MTRCLCPPRGRKPPSPGAGTPCRERQRFKNRVKRLDRLVRSRTVRRPRRPTSWRRRSVGHPGTARAEDATRLAPELSLRTCVQNGGELGLVEAVV
ncbi:hypothetical protein NDU88_007755 [Pleurodeles waltl]|uniref:Uncharacterized protein n=1 Tax=Pleurodeles waltl TaxID=8319 RepID=A0AAV7LUU5_PLEWA|nr:hypothetical protein NDU88_007755 [Pleurodeles waltl]